MATRSFIARKTSNGYEGCYCHWDGYPEGVGKTLAEHYQDEGKLTYLLSFGDISSLGSNIGWQHDFDQRDDFGSTTFYGRDRGETGSGIQTKHYRKLQSLLKAAANMGCEFVYLYDAGRWKVASRGLQFFGMNDGDKFSRFEQLEAHVVLS